MLWWLSFTYNYLILFSTKSLHTLGTYHTPSASNLNFKSLKLGRHELVATKYRLQVLNVETLCQYCSYDLCFANQSFDLGIFSVVTGHSMPFHLSNFSSFCFKQYKIKNLTKYTKRVKIIYSKHFVYVILTTSGYCIVRVIILQNKNFVLSLAQHKTRLISVVIQKQYDYIFFLSNTIN